MVNNMISIVDVFKCDLFSGKNLPFGLLYKRLKLLTIHYHYHKKHEAGKSNMYNDVIIHHSVYCSHCSYWVRMKHRIVLYFICSKICTFFSLESFSLCWSPCSCLPKRLRDGDEWGNSSETLEQWSIAVLAT